MARGVSKELDAMIRTKLGELVEGDPGSAAVNFQND